MLTWIKQLRTAPVFEGDENKTRIASLLNTILPTVFVITSILTLFAGMHAVEASGVVTGATTAIVALVMWFIVRRGYVRFVSILLSSLLFAYVTLTIYFNGTVLDPVTIVYGMCIVTASLLIGARAATVFNVLILLALFGLLQAETSGRLTPITEARIEIHDWATYGTVFTMMVVLLNMATRSINEALAQARSNERALAERAREIAVFRALAKNAADAILMSTLEGEITYSNRAGYEIFGYDYEERELIGMRLSDLIPKEETENVNQRTISTTLRQGSWRGEMRHQRKDASLFDADSTFFVVQAESGEKVALASIIRDITAQKRAEAEREHLQQEVIEAQRQALLDLSSPVIPVLDAPDGSGGIIVMPLVGNIDATRAREVTRSMLAGIKKHQAQVVILDITGVPVVDSDVAENLNKTVKAARLKGARTIVTGISEAVAETIVDLGIDWGGIKTVSDLQTGLVVALDRLGLRITV